MLTAELQKLEVRQESLERQLTEIDEPAAPIIHPALPELYRKKVAGLKEALADSNQEAIELIRSLIEGIALVPEDGRVRIDLHAELAGILAVCSDAKKPGQSGTERAAAYSQYKVVAGTGFEPVTFRL